MKLHTYKITYILISSALYAICLALPGFYIGETYEPYNSAELLLIGWLGPLDAHFSWYANLTYGLAILTIKKHKTSLIFSCIALLLALSFLMRDSIIVNEAGHSAKITAYGLGYFFWITAILLLTVTQYHSCKPNRSPVSISIATIAILLAGSAAYTLSYVNGENSRYKIEKARAIAFSLECSKVKTITNGYAEDVKSVYLQGNWRSSYEKRSDGKWYPSGSGVIFNGAPKSLDFYEVDTEKGEPRKYLRYSKGRTGPTHANSLNSEYSVVVDRLKLPRRLNIQGADIRISRTRDGTLLATTRYVYNASDLELCADSNAYNFDSWSLAKRTLGL
jgi:hypothetical protein